MKVKYERSPEDRLFPDICPPEMKVFISRSYPRFSVIARFKLKGSWAQLRLPKTVAVYCENELTLKDENLLVFFKDMIEAYEKHYSRQMTITIDPYTASF
jgi:hypothetical protein